MDPKVSNNTDLIAKVSVRFPAGFAPRRCAQEALADKLFGDAATLGGYEAAILVEKSTGRRRYAVIGLIRSPMAEEGGVFLKRN